MIREPGEVVEVRDGSAIVSMAAAAHAQCGSCGMCKMAEDGERRLTAVRAPEGVQPGDKVTVEIPVPGPAQSAAILFLVPLVIFIGGLLAAEQLRASGVIPGGGGLSVLVALGLAVLWYVAVGMYDRHLRRSAEHQPRIVDWPGR